MPNTNRKNVLLLILDGWGIGKEDKYNAILNAKTPNYDRLIRDYPNTSLKSDGPAVGLPEGQTGTSEVNHFTIGAGRVVWQTLPLINNSISDGTFFANPALNETIDHVEATGGRLHLAGILSDGGVHSHIEHVYALLDLLKKRDFKRPVYFHIFTDGRDAPPKSAETYLKALSQKMQQVGIGQIATMQGRYLLDRDRDWEKTETACNLIFKGAGNEVTDWQAAINLAYNQVNTDEYLPQYVLDKQGLLTAGDGLIFYHYRTDRLYQIAQRILNENLANFSFTALVQPSAEFTKLKVAFPQPQVAGTMAEVIAEAGLKQLHVTETEKFPHVTFFLNGQREKELPQETWTMHESNRFVKPQYNFEPSMQNYKITQTIIEGIKDDKFNFIVANLSSADMVGHTGNYAAAVVSAESVDYCLGQIYEVIKAKLDSWAMIITADHGNSEEMWDYENNQPHTQHTLNKVPLILVSDIACKLNRRETLEDIAPTVLELLGLEIPKAMTGTNLIEPI